MAKTFPSLMKTFVAVQTTDPRMSTNEKHKKYADNYTQAHTTVRLLKNSDKKEILRAAREKRHYV